MMMFGNKPFHPEMIDASSKLSLRLSCIRSCENDISRARELYGFLSEGLEDIPDVTPVQPDGFTKVRQGADEVFAWLSSHKDDIVQGISLVRSLRPKVPADVPPIPKL